MTCANNERKVSDFRLLGCSANAATVVAVTLQVLYHTDGIAQNEPDKIVTS